MANELARQRYARKNEQDELERVFKTLDRNADGKVDPEELGLLFQMLNHKVSERAAGYTYGPLSYPHLHNDILHQNAVCRMHDPNHRLDQLACAAQPRRGG